MKLLTVARNGIRPSYFPVMAHKVYLRARHRIDAERAAATTWAREQARDMDGWARALDAGAWAQALEFAGTLQARLQPRIDELNARGIFLGGGGSYELLYFLTRLRRPDTVLETGVAAGWSTTAFLAGLAANDRGHLYSSDFPYFRIADPERYVGYLVPDELKSRWTLHTKGDRRNLPQILRPGRTLDLVHYDSDKTRAGREFFLRRVADHVTPATVLVMDDINDDLCFRDHVTHGGLPFAVFEYHGKYIGIAGQL